ncbi:MAG: helix-turn-helix domain-containing protein [Dethiobacter sp.]|nr:helix-turn-helix domain-containing protein [Dethiobacter sp.]
MLEKHLKNIRTKKKLSLEELSASCKLPAAYLQDVEDGKVELTCKALDSLASILDFDDESEDNLTINTSGLGNRIRAMREEKDLTLESLGDALGLSITYLSDIERGERVPSLQTIQKISRYFNIPVSLLIDSESKLFSMGKKIRLVREAKGLTQKQLAITSGLSSGMIAQLESGKVQPSLKTIEKIAATLGVSTCYLILEQADIDGIIAGVGPDMRELLFDPTVQMLIGHVCTLNNQQLRLVFNFIQMLKSPVV